MIEVKVAYDSKSGELYRDLQKWCLLHEIMFEGYTEEIYKERKKAFAIKNIGATRQCPFVVMFVDGEPKMAWYAEQKVNTYDKITSDINEYSSTIGTETTTESED